MLHQTSYDVWQLCGRSFRLVYVVVEVVAVVVIVWNSHWHTSGSNITFHVFYTWFWAMEVVVARQRQCHGRNSYKTSSQDFDGWGHGFCHEADDDDENQEKLVITSNPEKPCCRNTTSSTSGSQRETCQIIQYMLSPPQRPQSYFCRSDPKKKNRRGVWKVGEISTENEGRKGAIWEQE